MLKPLGNRVFVKRDEYASKTSGGILLPATMKDQPLRGVVVAVGDGKKLDNGTIIPTTVQVGDVVLFTKHNLESITVDNDEYLVFEEDKLVGIIRE